MITALVSRSVPSGSAGRRRPAPIVDLGRAHAAPPRRPLTGCSLASSSASARWPVSDRNTSSRLGSRTASVSGSMPSRRARAGRRSGSCAPSFGRDAQRPVVALDLAVDVARQQGRGALGAVRRSSNRASPRPCCRAATSGSTGCRSRSPGRRRRRRCARRAGRPPPGTAWSAGRSCRRRPARSIVSHSALRLRGSSPVVGSSRNRTGGRRTSDAAMSKRRRMPPEYVRSGRSAASVSSNFSSSSAARGHDLRRRQLPEDRRPCAGSRGR